MHFFRRSIFAKYISLTLLVGGLLNFVILALYWDRARTAQSSAVATDISTLSNAIAGPVLGLLERGEKNEARKLMAVFSGYPHIICADFYDGATESATLSWPVIGCARIKKQGTMAEVPLALTAPDAKMVLRLDDRLLRRTLSQEMFLILALGVLGGLALIGSGALSFRRFIGKPLKKMLTAIDIFERENVPQQINHDSTDEVGRVVTSYNQMLAREAERVGALRNAHRQTLESVSYATRIQKAILPSEKDCQTAFAEFGKIWRPRDLVSGDVYWLRRSGTITTLVVVDCTGHGVPGGFMTMIAAATLDRVYQDGLDIPPARALARLSDLTKSLLDQGEQERHANNGMDAAILQFDSTKPYVLCASGQLSVLVETSEGFERIKGDRISLGYRDTETSPVFREHKIDVTDQPLIVVATDGLIDQIGGPHLVSFGFRRLLDVLSNHRTAALPDLLSAVADAHDTYAGDQVQRDDITLVALRPHGEG